MKNNEKLIASLSLSSIILVIITLLFWFDVELGKALFTMLSIIAIAITLIAGIVVLSCPE